MKGAYMFKNRARSRRRLTMEQQLDTSTVRLQIITILSDILNNAGYTNLQIDSLSSDDQPRTIVKQDIVQFIFDDINLITSASQDVQDDITNELTDRLKASFESTADGIPPYASIVNGALVVGIPLANIELESQPAITEGITKSDANKVVTTMQGSDNANVQLILAKYLNTPLTTCYSKILSIVGDAKASNQILLNYVDAICRKS